MAKNCEKLRYILDSKKNLKNLKNCKNDEKLKIKNHRQENRWENGEKSSKRKIKENGEKLKENNCEKLKKTRQEKSFKKLKKLEWMAKNRGLKIIDRKKRLKTRRNCKKNQQKLKQNG